MADITAKRVVVVVLGMHRSGTSLLARAISLLGVSFGSRLIQADANNRGGYYEHEGIVGLHKRLLTALDRGWVEPKGTLDLPAHWWTREEVQGIVVELRETMAAEMAAADPDPFGFKDPRATRVLPLWRQIFRELHVEPIWFLSVRNPAAVAASIEKRDAIPASRTHLLWLQHNLDALAALEGEPVHVVDYDRWFTDFGRQSERIQRALPSRRGDRPEDAPYRLAGLVEQGMRHYTGGADRMPALLADLYAGLAEAASTGVIPARVGQARAEFRMAKELMRGWGDLIEELGDHRLPSEAPPGRKPQSAVARVLQALRRDPTEGTDS
jgi:hypothetical protein